MKFDDFKDELEILKLLFKDNVVDKKFKHLKHVFEKSESHWNENLSYIKRKNIKIKYLLIAEAPPGKNIENTTIKYIYNPAHIKDQNYLKVIYRCFYHVDKITVSNSDIKKEMISRIADKGFILIDSLPFAMDYSVEFGPKRNRPEYEELIQMCWKNYLIPKMKNYDIPWTDEEFVRVGFSVRLNGERVIKHFKNSKLPFTHNLHTFDETFDKEKTNRNDCFAVSNKTRWNLDPEQFKRIFELHN